MSHAPINAYDEKSEQGKLWAKGYVQCLRDYGIWNSGVQTIGCLETPIKEIIKDIAISVDLKPEEI
jgi:hypothetical protein